MVKFSVEKDEEEEEDNEAGPSNINCPTNKKRKSSSTNRDQEEHVPIDDGNQNSVRSEKDGGNCNSISVTLIDPEVLDCSICMEPLTPPIFQCENGHIACSSCCTKLGNKCPSCSWPIGYNRCRAIEKVIESIKVSCRYALYGCKETLGYKQKITHEETCVYAPCSCPVSDCMFVGSSEQLYIHFSNKHWASAIRFRYNCPFSISFGKDESVLVFQGEDDGRLFLLNNHIEPIGNALSVTCIGPSSMMGGFSYDLISRRGGSSLRLQSFTKNVKREKDPSRSEDFLLVPCDFYRGFGQLKMEVCIWSSRELG